MLCYLDFVDAHLGVVSIHPTELRRVTWGSQSPSPARRAGSSIPQGQCKQSLHQAAFTGSRCVVTELANRHLGHFAVGVLGGPLQCQKQTQGCHWTVSHHHYTAHVPFVLFSVVCASCPVSSAMKKPTKTSPPQPS